MMIIVTAVLAAALAVALTALVVGLLRARRPAGESGLLIQQQMDSLRDQTAAALTANTDAVARRLEGMTGELNQRLSALDARLEGTTGLIGQRLDSAHRTVQGVSAALGELSQAARSIYDVGKNIASLQEILRAPKLRGVVGELFLGNLLDQVVPENYELQHHFQSGETVDAVIRLGPKLVPIDAKFPLENFQRLTAAGDAERKPLRRRFIADVKKHVDAIAGKYIVPDEGTYDFALMYIPAENVYYETIIKDDPDEENVSAYAVSRRVIPVSPNSLYAYLQAIVFGLRGLQIEKRAEEILSHLSRLQGDFGRFRDDFDTVGTHLKNAHNKYDDALKRLGQLEGKLEISSALAEQGSPTPPLPPA